MIDIHATLEKASKLKIAVIGDLIVDRYIYGDVHRISPEAPVPVVNKTDTKVCMGGAGNVFMNLLNLGVDVDLYCNFNQDPFWGEELMMRIFTNPYPAAVKTRVMSGQHHLLRIDDEIMPDQIEWPTFKQVSWWKHLEEYFILYDRIVICDYHKGVVSDSLINAILELVEAYKTSFHHRKYIPVIVDAKRDFNRFNGAYIIKCNRKEFDQSSAGIFESLTELVPYGNIRIVTNGESGISWYTPRGKGGVDGLPVNIVDVCGAGDTVTAILATVDEGPDLNELCQLANIAASEVCKYSGVHAITKDELIRRYNEVHLRLSIDDLNK